MFGYFKPKKMHFFNYLKIFRQMENFRLGLFRKLIWDFRVHG